VQPLKRRQSATEQFMQLEPTSDQLMMVDTFARFLDTESSIARVRAASLRGFDRMLWKGLAELGALTLRVPEEAGGLGLGIFDAGLLMEEAGRRLASGPLAEAIVAARLLAQLDPVDQTALRGGVASGDSVVTIAMHDCAVQRAQLVAGGAVADAVIALEGSKVVLLRSRDGAKQAERTLASTPIARLQLDQLDRIVLAQGDTAVAAFSAAIEEWKLLISLALSGLAREATRLASVYACERAQFGRPIGSFQAISHPLASIAVEVDAGRLMAWQAIRAIADRAPQAGAAISSAAWWACMAAEKAVGQALHTFGGYGLTLEYDIHLYSLRAKAWPLVLGDPHLLLEEAARRRYDGEVAHLPDAGPVSVEFGLGEESEALAAETRAFFEANMTPELRAKAHYSFAGHDPGFHKKLGEAGLLFPAWPKRMGGRGASPYVVQATIKVWDEYNWTTHMRGTCNIIGFIMDRFGSDQLKAEALSRVISGDASCALGFSEPGSGSDVFAAKTRATREGDGWRIDGQKMFTSGAESADYVLLLARTDPEAAKHLGLTMFIVPLKAEGVTIQAVHTFQEERTNITYYDGVHIPDSYRLGEVGGGAKVMASSLEIEHGMSFVRDHEELLHAAERFCRQTQRNGRSMIEDAGVQLRLTRTAANVNASQMLHYRALWVSAERKTNLAYGPSSKMFSSEVYKSDSCDLLNMTAPESLAFASVEAAFINLCFRHSQVSTIYGGTSEVHRSMIAEKQLGLPRTR
jgi:alkylation response protein AidB-like acyl-CoA dehydrogenase